MAAKKTAAEKAAEKAPVKDAEEVEAEAEAKAEDKAEHDGEVTVPADVLQDTGVAAGGLDPAAEEPKAAEPVEGGLEQAPVDGPFANSAVAGATRQHTFAQKAQLYTDGLSGQADHNMDRAYGDELATEEQNKDSEDE